MEKISESVIGEYDKLEKKSPDKERIKQILMQVKKNIKYRSIRFKVSGKQAMYLTFLLDRDYDEELEYVFEKPRHRVVLASGSFAEIEPGKEFGYCEKLGGYFSDDPITKLHIKRLGAVSKNLSEDEIIRLAHKESEFCEHCVSVIITIKG